MVAVIFWNKNSPQYLDFCMESVMFSNSLIRRSSLVYCEVKQADVTINYNCYSYYINIFCGVTFTAFPAVISVSIIFSTRV